jgi:hypothetical protein
MTEAPTLQEGGEGVLRLLLLFLFCLRLLLLLDGVCLLDFKPGRIFASQSLIRPMRTHHDWCLGNIFDLGSLIRHIDRM